THELVIEELRRSILGYDIYEARIKRLAKVLEVEIPDDVSDEFCQELAAACGQLEVFLDVERLFTCSTRHRLGTGELDLLSNNALMRLFVRRLRADGSGLPERFLDVLKLAMAHYDDVKGRKQSAGLQRAVLRLFASQLEPELRFTVISATLLRVVALSRRIDLSGDERL